MKISVAMTTYNGARYLRDQLDSIFAQTRVPDELIVCDDRSTDATPELLREYSARAPFPMRLVFNEQRLGSTKNFEQAIRLCTGDIIALSDQDDVWYPHKLATIERRFEADPDVGVGLSNADLIDDDGAQLRGDLWSRGLLKRKRHQALSGLRRYDLLLGLPVTTGATMAFRSRFKALALPIPTECPTFIHDRWIAVLIAAVARIAIIDEKLLAYRLHRRQQLGIGAPLPLKVLVPHRCWSDVIALAALDERLKDNPSTNPHFRSSLAERQRHVVARTKLARNPFRRLAQVASELRSGRYTLYPHGLAVALQDLLVGIARPAVPVMQASDYARDSATEVCGDHA
jgi:glycosyltransferase involved in cell wall biosynthesis